MTNLAELKVAIGSDISELESGLTRGESKVDAFASKVSKTGDVAATGFTNAGSKVGGFGSSVDDAGTRADGLGSKLGRVGEIAGGFLAANVVGKGLEAFKGFIGDSIEASSALNESLNAVSKVFGQSQQKIFDWGKSNANSFGLSQRAFYEMATPLGAGLKNAGLSMDQVAGNTIALTERAADMASVFNTSVPDALEAIQAGLRGEADPLERYGVGLTAARVQAEALTETHKKTASSLTTQELALARVKLIMDQTNTSAGDFKSTSDQYANSQRIAAAKTEELQAKIGDKLIPVMLQLNQVKLALVSVIADKLLPVLAPLLDLIGKHPVVLMIMAAVIGGVVVAAFGAWAVVTIGAAAAMIGLTWPIIAIIAAVALLVAGIAYLISNWDALSGAVGGFISYTSSTFIDGLNQIGAAIGSFFSYTGSTFMDGLNQIGGYVAAGISYTSSTFIDGLNQMGSAIARFFSYAASIFIDGLNQMGSYVARGASYVSSTFMSGLNQMGSAAGSGITYVVSVIGGLPGRIVSAVGNLGSLLYNAGRDVVSGLWNGILSLGSWLETQIINFIKSFVPGPVLQYLGIASPSRLFEGIGRNVSAGLAAGITGNTGMVADAAAALAQTATGSFAPVAVSGVARAGFGVPAGVAAAAGTGREPIVLEFRGDGGLIELIKKTVRFAGGDAQKAFT